MSPIQSAPITCSATETKLRDLLKSIDRVASRDLPSLASLKTLIEQLQVENSSRWSMELAQEFGKVVFKCMMRFAYVKIWNDASSNESNATDSETAGAATLGRLATVFEDWEDHVLYAVLIQVRGNENRSNVILRGGEVSDKTKKKLTKEYNFEHLLDLLTALSARPNVVDNAQTFKGESIHQNATRSLAIAWRCLERLQRLTAPMSRNINISCVEHMRTPWWMPEGQLMSSLAVVSLRSLCHLYCCLDTKNSDDICSQKLKHRYSGGDTEQLKIASLTVVAILLRYQLLVLSPSSLPNHISALGSTNGCLISERKLCELISKLIKEIRILNYSVLSPSTSEYALPIAMLSFSVLTLLQRSLASWENESLFHGFDQTIQSTGMVENLVQFTFLASISTSSHSGSSLTVGPKWTSLPNRYQSCYLRSFALHLFSCWNLCDSTIWEVLVSKLETKLNFLIDAFWWSLLGNDHEEHRKLPRGDNFCLKEKFPCILWLICYMRRHVRYRLSLVLKKAVSDPGAEISSPSLDACTVYNVSKEEILLRKLMRSLFGFIKPSSGISDSDRLMVAKLIQILLADSRTVSISDDLSQNLWMAIDESMVEDYFEVVLKHTSPDDAYQALLLVFFDTIEIMLDYNNRSISLVNKLGAYKLEKLINLVESKKVRYEFILCMQEKVTDVDVDSSSHHHTSRLNETSICVGYDESKLYNGLHDSIQLSLATCLARLANDLSTVQPDESIGLLISRISSTVNEFLFNYHFTTIEWGQNSTCDSSRTTPSIDEIMRFMRLKHRFQAPDTDDYLSTTVMTGLMLRKKKRLKLLNMQKDSEHRLHMALLREREAQDKNLSLVQHLRTQSILFHRELSYTKINLTQDTKQLISMHTSDWSYAKERSRRLLRQSNYTTIELERIKKEFHSTRAQLQNTRLQINELSCIVDRLQQEAQDEKLKANEIIKGNKQTIQSYEQKYIDMQNTICERDGMVYRGEGTTRKLKDDLEGLFRDMCSLVQIYQRNESQQELQKHKNIEAIKTIKHKFIAEYWRNEGLTSKIRNIEEESEKLYRKLGKYKERLEQEREVRRQVQERGKDEKYRRKRNEPVSYLNSLHKSATSNMYSP